MEDSPSSLGLSLTPARAGLATGRDQTLDVLVRVRAPDAPPAGSLADRPPQALALVIDRSGSMRGHPLREALRCAELVLSRLRPTDHVALVQFDHRVERLWPAAPLGDGRAQREALTRITAGGNTALHGGWLEGATALTEAPAHLLRRVILLSDGAANQGETDPERIAADCKREAGRGITTSTYGLGHHFNEDLMVAMGRAGGGNHYYGETADDLRGPFEQELALLENLALRDVQLGVAVPAGVRVELLNGYAVQDGGWRLPDVAWGAEAWALLRLHLNAGEVADRERPWSGLTVAVKGKDLAGAPVELPTVSLSVPVLDEAGWQALPEDEVVARRRVELEAAEALQAMRAAAGRGEWAQVDALIETARVRFAGAGWVETVLAAMSELAAQRDAPAVVKEFNYSSERMRTRLAQRGEGVKFSMAAEAGVPAYLRRERRQGKSGKA